MTTMYNPVEIQRIMDVNQGLSLDSIAFLAAWRAYQQTPIDLLADSDDEDCRCVGNAIKAYLTSIEWGAITAGKLGT